jgi:hypothetical protein
MAEITNQWSYTSNLPTCLHGVDRSNFNFSLFLPFTDSVTSIGSLFHNAPTLLPADCQLSIEASVVVKEDSIGATGVFAGLINTPNTKPKRNCFVTSD